MKDDRITDYSPVEAFVCRFSGNLVRTFDQALDADIASACHLIADEVVMMEQIHLLRRKTNHYNDHHRAVLFLAEIINEKVALMLEELK